MHLPIVSVITVAFNAEIFIEKTICSVISQTGVSFEYIIVDGKSTDRTLEIIERYRDRISTIISEPDHGIYDAMNKGIKNAHGAWIIFMNAGDVFCNNNVLRSLALEQKPENVAVVYGDSISRYGRDYYLFPAKQLSVLEKDGMAFCHQAAFVRTSIMRKFLFDTSYKLLADFNFFRKLFLEHYSFMHVELPVCFYDFEGGATDSHRMLCCVEREKIVNNTASLPVWKYLMVRVMAWLHRYLPYLLSLYRRKKYAAFALSECQREIIFSDSPPSEMQGCHDGCLTSN